MNNIFFDGSTQLNSVCVYDESGKRYIMKRIDEVCTNNELEYYALLVAVRYVNRSNYKLVDCMFIGDSELIIKQMKGEYGARRGNMKMLRQKVADEIFRGGYVGLELADFFKWVPRDENMAGKYLDRAMRK